MALQTVFEDFKRNKEALLAIHRDTEECFQKIQDSLLSQRHGRELATQLVKEMTMAHSPPAADPGSVDFADDLSAVMITIEGKECSISSLAESLYTREEREEVCKLFEKEGRPSLIVIGQTNSGKSSIINEILGFKIVSTSDQPCTSRIVKLTHSKDNYIELVTPGSTKVLEKITTQKTPKIPRELIELKQEDRENPERVTAIVKAGFDIPFLESGVDVIDSPGRNENPVLDDLVRKQLDSILPFIVYVIDGHNLFTAQDNEVLREIVDKNGGLEVFFVVSKIEPQESDSSDEDEDDEEDGSEMETVQESKKRRVFEQLVKNGYLTPDKDRHSNENFHGLSAWKLYEYRRKIKKNPQWKDSNNVYKEYTDAFDRFQSCLKTYAESCLKGCVKFTCQKLIAVLSRCLYFFIEKANLLKQNRDASLLMLKEIDKEVSILHENILKQILKQKEEIKDVMASHVKYLEKDVCDEAKSFTYSEEFVMLAKDGYVSGTEAVSQCRTQLEQMVFNKVQKEVKTTLESMFRSRDDFLENLIKKMKTIEEEALSGEENSTSASDTLYSTLVVCYEPDIECSTGGWSFQRILKQIAEWVKRFFTRPLITVKGKVKVGDPKWKEKVALDTLGAIDVSKIGEDLVKTLQTHFETCYGRFKVQLLNIVDVLAKGETLKDEQRNAILKFAPDVASLEMLGHSVNDLIKYGRPQKGETIGAGAQGHVFTCLNIKTDEGKPCAVKVVPVPNESSLKDLTLELHTSRGLKHPNILPVVCTIIEPVLNGLTVSIVNELMPSDLHHALPNITSLRVRLNIVRDVASAAQYLHKKGLMHRDIKLQNVLVDQNNKGYLTDFGLCKPEGLASGSLVGTPMAMAPEMLLQKYTKSVDVYAFGILMWRVCEGTGKQPSNIFLFPVPIVMLVVNAKDDRKPEKLDKFSPSCWALMEKCWETDPDLRPSFDDIVLDLDQILADKSII